MKKYLYTCIVILALLSFNCAEAQYAHQNISFISNWSDPGVMPEPVYGIKYSGIWGWNDGVGNEYAIIGSSDGYYFVNVTNPAVPVVSDFVAGARDSCIWREMKTYSHYAYLISDDSPPNSLQIVDLQYLPDSVHVVYNSNTLFARAHTLFVDGNKLYCASVKGGQFSSQVSMAVFSLANPELPVLLRKLNDDFTLPFSPVHDMFVRNDTVYASAGYDGLFIFRYDSISNVFSYINSLVAYPSQGYNHSSALTDDSHTLIFMDEVPAGLPCKSMDVTDLQNLSVNTTFNSNVGATPHNPFIVGNICFVAYYQDGLQVFDVSNVNNPFRIGYFDTFYQNDASGSYFSPAYQGAWGAYPFLPSGKILVSDMQNGLFILDASGILSVASVKKATSVSLFPNPLQSGTPLQFDFNGSTLSARVSIMDNAGRVVFTTEIQPSLKGEIVLPRTSPGLYTVEFNSNERGKFSQKLVITE